MLTSLFGRGRIFPDNDPLRWWEKTAYTVMAVMLTAFLTAVGISDWRLLLLFLSVTGVLGYRLWRTDVHGNDRHADRHDDLRACDRGYRLTVGADPDHRDVGMAVVGNETNARWRPMTDHTVHCSACGSTSRHDTLDGDERWAARHWCKARTFITGVRDWANDIPWPLKLLAVIWAGIALGLLLGAVIAGRR